MTPAEATTLLVYVSAFDNRQLDDGHGEAWANVLDPRLTLQGAKWIVDDHYKTSRKWLMPADINAKFLKVRRERIEAHGNEIPYPLDLPADRHLEFRRAWEDAIGNGTTDEVAIDYACHQIGHNPQPVKLVGPPPGALERFLQKIKEEDL